MFSDQIKFHRKEKKVTQKQLASDLGLTVRTIQNYESGASVPRSKVIRTQIADYFDVTVSKLFEN